MKFNLNKGNVTLTSETEKEALQLFGIAVKTTDAFGEVERVQIHKPHKKHKKHNHVKTCEFCGKGFKGLIGVGIHKARCPKKPGVTMKPFEEVWK
jgi:hypothetical protein